MFISFIMYIYISCYLSKQSTLIYILWIKFGWKLHLWILQNIVAFVANIVASLKLWMTFQMLQLIRIAKCAMIGAWKSNFLPFKEKVTHRIMIKEDSSKVLLLDLHYIFAYFSGEATLQITLSISVISSLNTFRTSEHLFKYVYNGYM